MDIGSGARMARSHNKKEANAMQTEASTPKDVPALDPLTLQAALENTTRYQVMHEALLRYVHSWAFWLIALGAIHLVANGFLSGSWGILLIVVGLASFYFRDVVMLIVYAVTLTWAGVANLTSGQVAWAGFALIQFLLAFQVVRRYRGFRKTEAVYQAATALSGSVPASARAARVFPWAGCVLGGLAPIGFVAALGAAIYITTRYHVKPLPSWVGLMENGALGLGILGFALGLASLLSGYRPKWAAILGIVAAALVLIIEILARVT